jgi:hypothetical protein
MNQHQKKKRKTNQWNEANNAHAEEYGKGL